MLEYFTSYVSADLGFLGNVESHHLRLATGGCIVCLSWTPPQDTPTENLKHYSISVDGSHHIITKNITGNLNTEVFHNSDCLMHNFTISAINTCGRSGLSVTNFTLQYPISYQELMTIASNTGYYEVTPPTDLESVNGESIEKA